jgi:hypothetical protein
MEQYLPWLFTALGVAVVIVALLYARMSQVESD